MKILYTFLFFILGFQQPLIAANYQYENHNDIKQKVADFLNTSTADLDGEITVIVNNIDQRLRLRKCPLAYNISTTNRAVKAGSNTIQVSCASDTPWRIFITGHVQILKQVLLASKPIMKGHLLTASDIKRKKIDISKTHINYFQDPAHVINKTAKRNIRVDSILSANILTEPLLIKRGDRINIVAANNGFKITMKGIAMSNGSKGERIKVKNLRTKKIIQGIITGKSTVNVNI